MSQFQNFIAGMTMSMPPRVDVFPANNELFNKGDTAVVNSSGFMTHATNTLAPDKKLFVVIKEIDNSAGVAGAVGVSVVGSGQRVTVLCDTTLYPGQGIKISPTTNNAVSAHLVGTDATNLLKGHYIGIEPSVYSKSGTTPYLESFTTNSNPEVNASASSIVIVELL